MALLADIPKYGFGTAFSIGSGEGKTSEQGFRDLLVEAIKLGCRHFDCAPLYGTQRLVGSTLNSAMTTLNIPREELFVTSKLSANMMQGDNIDRSLKSTLADLGLSYLDLYLVHAPFSTKFVQDNEMYPLDAEGNLLLDERDGLLEQAWTRLAQLKELGLVKRIGLSNINIKQLDRLNKIHQVDVVQNEYHLYNQDRELFDYCEELDVHYEAYAAFGCPPRAKRMGKPTFFADPIVCRIARENSLSCAQVIIQWLHQQPLSYIIRSDNICQLEENLKATSKITLSINDMIDLDSLNQNARLYRYDNYPRITSHSEYPFKRSQVELSQPLSEHKKETASLEHQPSGQSSKPE